jgi:hypothetical protein
LSVVRTSSNREHRDKWQRRGFAQSVRFCCLGMNKMGCWANWGDECGDYSR